MIQYPELDRSALKLEPLSACKNKVKIEKKQIRVTDAPGELSDIILSVIKESTLRIQAARAADRPVFLAFGAHTIKNGLASVLIKLMEFGVLTHLATNSAGIIHDWEFSFQGENSKDVRENIDRGRFGIWQEPGFYINLGTVVGMCEGRGYGESIGAMADADGLNIPTEETLTSEIAKALATDAEHADEATDLLEVIRRFNIPSGKMEIKHRFKSFGVQAPTYGVVDEDANSVKSLNLGSGRRLSKDGITIDGLEKVIRVSLEKINDRYFYSSDNEIEIRIEGCAMQLPAASRAAVPQIRM